MIRSMTGYSRFRQEDNGCIVTASVKATNHRFLDLQIRFSPGLESFEPALRQLVRKHVARGHVELQVSLERTGATELQIDRHLLDAYIAALQRLRQEFCFTSDPDLVALLRIPGMVAAANGEMSTEDLDRLRLTVERAADRSLGQLNEMRAREGANLERDLRTRLDRLRALVAQVDRLAQNAPQSYRGRLEKRLEEMLASTRGAELDATRLARKWRFWPRAPISRKS